MQTQFTTLPLPYFFIGKDLTAERIGNYAGKHTLLSQSIGKPDTRSVWYSKDHLSKLMDEIDHANGDGIRVFFGSYEATHQEYAGQTCLLMVVTREKQVGENSMVHENVILEEAADFNDRSALPRGISFPDSQGDILGRKRDFNHGSPCPPVCDGGEGEDFP